MALRWFLHSLGYQPDDMQYCKNRASEQSGGVTQSSKVSSNGELTAVKAKIHLASGFQMPATALSSLNKSGLRENGVESGHASQRIWTKFV
ncbi:hypothetical protein Goarm_005409, partial [Gossypium armourianum]|nr:hypothetical protein [Gossypium armourianum]